MHEEKLTELRLRADHIYEDDLRGRSVSLFKLDKHHIPGDDWYRLVAEYSTYTIGTVYQGSREPFSGVIINSCAEAVDDNFPEDKFSEYFRELIRFLIKCGFYWILIDDEVMVEGLPVFTHDTYKEYQERKEAEGV